MQNEESVYYKIMIDLITSIVERYINNDGEITNDGADKSLDVGKLAI